MKVTERSYMTYLMCFKYYTVYEIQTVQIINIINELNIAIICDFLYMFNANIGHSMYHY